ncbi:extracellular solute-binding protein [Pseudonocardia sp. GCM10023141]|uniref:extracellular solute-binding protein n=1 Tax=Pseudonocardia sp. GCM10023141 TaxID=3252653 RepID=UPI0036090421
MSTWEDYFAFGVELQKAIPNGYLITDAKTVFTYSMAQEPRKYLDRQGHFIGDDEQVQRAWDRALTAVRMKLTAGYFDNGQSSGSVDRHAAWNNGTELSLVNASWITAELKEAAPGTAGTWRICRNPGGPGNQGGSFVAITRYCPQPQAAFDIISWLLSPANQARNYVDAGLFPVQGPVPDRLLPAERDVDRRHGDRVQLGVLHPAPTSSAPPRPAAPAPSSVPST